MRKSTFRRPLALFATAVGLGLLAAPPVAGQPVPDVTFTELTPRALLVRVINPDGAQLGANMVVLQTEDQNLLVDTNFPHPQLARYIRQSVEARVGPLSAVVVTHWHPDHSGGIEAYADLPVYAHAEVIRRLAEETVGIDLGRLGNRFTSPPRPMEGRPNHPAEEGDRMAGDALVLHHPAAAHTDGDIYVEGVQQNVMVMADLLWPGRFPSVDVHNGGTPRGVRDAIHAALRLAGDDTIFVPGHGDPASRSEVEAFAAMLDETIDIVAQRARARESLESIQADDPLAAWSGWAHPLVPSEQWIKLIFGSLSD